MTTPPRQGYVFLQIQFFGGVRPAIVLFGQPENSIFVHFKTTKKYSRGPESGEGGVRPRPARRRGPESPRHSGPRGYFGVPVESEWSGPESGEGGIRQVLFEHGETPGGGGAPTREGGAGEEEDVAGGYAVGPDAGGYAQDPGPDRESGGAQDPTADAQDPTALGKIFGVPEKIRCPHFTCRDTVTTIVTPDPQPLRFRVL